MRDLERIERIQRTLNAEHYDALVCALPSNVLLLSGYFPVIGTTIAVATQDGAIALLVPEDELDLAQHGWADELQTFLPVSSEKLSEAAAEIRQPLHGLLTKLSLTNSNIGYERAVFSQPAGYSALHLYGESLPAALRDAVPLATLRAADDLLLRLRGVKTAREIASIRIACQTANAAFAAGAAAIRPGMLETQVAELFHAALCTPPEHAEAIRSEGFAWCMGGANSAYAGRAYALSRPTPVNPNDLALIHCNSHVDGYWTDITRTYCLGEPDRQLRTVYEAVFGARAAALAEIKPGVAASQIDAAARAVLGAHGLEKNCTHPIGHGVGFSAIDHGALPRLHSQSPDVLEPGMVFNVEPAAYLDEIGGIRQCEMVAVTDQGYELLTPFQTTLQELVVSVPEAK